MMNRAGHTPWNKGKSNVYSNTTLKQMSDSHKMPTLNRLLKKIQINNNGCWVWTGYRNERGYGYIRINKKGIRVHRFIYEYFHGEIDPNLTIDHTCRNTACVNPAHLELATNKENILRGNGLAAINARKTHCIRGHLLSGDNLYIGRDGKRNCRQCRTTIKKSHSKKREGVIS